MSSFSNLGEVLASLNPWSLDDESDLASVIRSAHARRRKRTSAMFSMAIPIFGFIYFLWPSSPRFSSNFLPSSFGVFPPPKQNASGLFGSLVDTIDLFGNVAEMPLFPLLLSPVVPDPIYHTDHPLDIYVFTDELVKDIDEIFNTLMDITGAGITKPPESTDPQAGYAVSYANPAFPWAHRIRLDMDQTRRHIWDQGKQVVHRDTYLWFTFPQQFLRGLVSIAEDPDLDKKQFPQTVLKYLVGYMGPTGDFSKFATELQQIAGNFSMELDIMLTQLHKLSLGVDTIVSVLPREIQYDYSAEIYEIKSNVWKTIEAKRPALKWLSGYFNSMSTLSQGLTDRVQSHDVAIRHLLNQHSKVGAFSSNGTCESQYSWSCLPSQEDMIGVSWAVHARLEKRRKFVHDKTCTDRSCKEI